MIEKIKELFKNKENIIKCSYLTSLILSVITLGLFALDLDTSSAYKNFYMIAFGENTTYRMWYLLAALIFFYYVLTEVYSLVMNFYGKRKDPKVKNNSLKYAKFNEISAIVITELFAIFILVFLCLTSKFYANINTGVCVLLGILAFVSLSFDGIGDYFEEVVTNIRAREIIEERKLEQEKAKALREKENKEGKKEDNKDVTKDVGKEETKENNSTTKKTSSSKSETK